MKFLTKNDLYFLSGLLEGVRNRFNEDDVYLDSILFRVEQEIKSGDN